MAGLKYAEEGIGKETTVVAFAVVLGAGPEAMKADVDGEATFLI